MGCGGLVLFGLLALAIPASIAPASLTGAYVLIVLFAGAGIALIQVRARRVLREDTPARRVSATVLVLVAAGVYAAVVTAIHAAT